MLEDVLKILNNHNLFLTGGGGVGKSHLTLEVIDSYKQNSKNVITLGSTGISAVSLKGVSLHSFFKFGISKNFEELMQQDKNQKSSLKKLYEMLEVVDLIVIDEISMVSADLMDMVYYRLQSSLFKGKILVVGDFYQLPPVKKANENSISLFNSFYAFSSTSWDKFKFKNVELKVSRRTSDKEFYEILSYLRVGEINEKVFTYLKGLLYSKVVPDENFTMLFGKNKDADRLNIDMLDRLDQDTHCIKANLEIYDNKSNELTIKNWIKSLNLLEELYLKVGAKVIFVVNNRLEGYYNGERGIILDILKDESGEYKAIVVKKDNGYIIKIPRYKFNLSKTLRDKDEILEHDIACFSQFPLKLAYALTIHKSQGMSIENLVCDLNNIFATGQLYVAMSRAVTPKKLKLIYGNVSTFNSYLKKVVRIDDDVKNFYKNTIFESIKES